MGINITITGLDEFIERIERLSKIDENVKDKFESIMQDTYDEIRSDCPVDTGFLRDSISLEPEEDFKYKITIGADYAGFVEFGHLTRSGTFVEPQYFIRPGYESMRGKIVSAVMEALAE